MEQNLIDLSERLLALYANNEIAAKGDGYTDAFKALVGEFQDTLSNVD